MKQRRSKLIIEIVGILITLIVGGAAISEINDDADDDCGYSCQVEDDD